MYKNLIFTILILIIQTHNYLLGACYHTLHIVQSDTLPKVIISSDNNNLSDKAPFSAQITFNKPVSGFEKEDIEVTNGYVHSFKGSVAHSASLGPDLISMVNFLDHPNDIAVDATGKIYIADAATHRIQIFDQNNNYISSIGSGSAGSGDYEFNSPHAIAFDGEGKLYVLDVWNQRIQIFDANLAYVNTLGLDVIEDNDGQYYNPVDIAVSNEGIIYTLDVIKNCVQVFDQNLANIATIGGPEAGTEPGKFNYPAGVDVDQNGNLYVADRHNFRVQIFDKEFNYVTSLGGNGQGAAPDQFSLPSSVTIDNKGNIYVGDDGNRDVRIFDAHLNFIGIIGDTGNYGKGNNQFYEPSAIAINSAGEIYIADAPNNRIQIFNSDLNYQSTIGEGSEGDGNYQFNRPLSSAISPAGNLYVVDYGNNRIQAYDEELTYISTLGGNGSGNANNRFRLPYGICFDKNGKIYVADLGNRRVQIFGPDHTYLATIQAPDQMEDWNPKAVAVDNNGRIYVVDYWNNYIFIYDSNLNHIHTIGTGESGYGNYEFSQPYDIALDAHNNIYIADYGHRRIQIYDSTYQYIATINNTGANYNFSVTGIAVDKLGNIYAADSYRHRVQIFNQDYQYVGTVGTGKNGINDGEFRNSIHVALDSLGNIYVVDQSNNRIQRFDPLTTYEIEIYPSTEGNVSIFIPEDVASDEADYGNEASNVLNINYDAPPSVYIYATPHFASDSLEVHFNFSEIVSDFSAEDIIISDGTLSSLTTTDSISFTATVHAMGSETVTIHLPEEAAYDISGNGNKAAKPVSFSHDNERPVFQMTSEASDPTNDSLILINGIFSKSVGLLSKDNFQVSNAVISSLSTGKPGYKATLGAEFEKIESYLGAPAGVAFDNQHHLYVASTKTNRIKIYDENLDYVTSIGDGSIGTGKYQFKGIADVAIDAQGMIYVADAGNHRVQIYNSDKKYVATIGTGEAGTENNQFNSPDAVAFDSEGKIYVVDRKNYRVQIFDANRNYIATLGTTGVSGVGNNQFLYPTAVAISPDDMIYIVDATNHRIQVFDANLEYFTTMGTSGTEGPGNHQLAVPNGVAIDSKGNIYIADLGNSRIQKFDKNRNYVSTINNQYTFIFPSMGLPIQVATDAQDYLYVVDTKRVYVFDQNLNQVASLGSDGSGDGNDQFYDPNFVYIDHQQKLYVADRLNHRVQIFDAKQNYLATLQGDKMGLANDQFQSPSGIAVDKLGNIYVADNYDKFRVQIFDQDLNFIGRLGNGTMGSGNNQLGYPGPIAFDKANNIYVVDRWNHRIQIFDHNRAYVATIGTGIAGDGNDQFYGPGDIAIDSLGNIYVVDGLNLRIQIFDQNRQYKATLGGKEADWNDNLFKSPRAVAVGHRGNIFVLDLGNQIKVFDAELNYLYTLGTQSGIKNDQFDNASDIAIDDKGNIYVADGQNHRVQLFNLSSNYQITVKPLQDGLVEVKLPADVTSDSHGNGNEEAGFNITYDSTGPSVSLSSKVDSLTEVPIIPVTISFSEEVTGFDLSDLKLTNATIKSLSTSDSIVFTTDITATQEGEVVITVPEEVVNDRAGNSNVDERQLVFHYILQPPTVELSSTEKDTTSLQAFPIKVAFSEIVFNFNTSDIQVSNAGIASLFTEDSTNFVAEVIPLNEGEIIVNIPSDVAQDRTGLGNTEAIPFSIVYHVADSVVEVPEEEPLRALLSTLSDTVGGDFLVEITFNRAVSDFSLSNVSVKNGYATALTTSDSTYFQLTITPGESGEVQVSLSEMLVASNEVNVLYEQKVVMGTIENVWEKEIKVYPIPANEEVIIEINLVHQPSASVILTTTDGKIVYQKIFYGSGKLQCQINITNLSPGIYYASISSNGQRIVRKIIKQ